MRISPSSIAGLLCALLFATGCPQPTTSWPQGSSISDSAYLNQALFDDGKAEVSFYQAYFKKGEQRVSFDMGTYLIKHNFDPERQSKASSGGVPSFKFAQFHEYVSGSEEFKYSYVVNAARADMRPMKASRNTFDWCSNQYRELAFTAQSKIQVLMRSDDYGNTRREASYREKTYPLAQLPLLIRALDFSKEQQADFSVLEMDGGIISAMAELKGKETIQIANQQVEAEKIRVFFAKSVGSLLTGAAEHNELIFWRGTDPARTLLKWQSEVEGGELEETLRSAYWQEDVFSRLKKPRAHP